MVVQLLIVIVLLVCGQGILSQNLPVTTTVENSTSINTREPKSCVTCNQGILTQNTVVVLNDPIDPRKNIVEATRPTFCRANEVYSDCGNLCEDTCANRCEAPISTSQLALELTNPRCKAGCYCSPGYIRNRGGICVTNIPNVCGCGEFFKLFRSNFHLKSRLSCRVKSLWGDFSACRLSEVCLVAGNLLLPHPSAFQTVNL
jgi:Trypsin Inhibitor like cysteine rich domain